MIVWIFFAITLSITAGGILSLFRFEKLKALRSYRYLQYYLILIYTFGFYGLWSTYFVDYLGAGEELLLKKVILFMATPFLVIGLIMQLLWINYMVNRPISNWILLVFSSILVVLLVYLYNTDALVFLSKASDLFNVFAAIVISFGFLTFTLIGTKALTRPARKGIFALLFLLIVLHIILVLDLGIGFRYVPMLFIVFFALHTGNGLVFIYMARVETIPESDEFNRRFDQFIAMHKITRREKEIITELCKGYTNQQVADALYITQQTVKDHTSRIYLKTRTKNRTQLVKMIMDLK